MRWETIFLIHIIVSISPETTNFANITVEEITHTEGYLNYCIQINKIFIYI